MGSQLSLEVGLNAFHGPMGTGNGTRMAAIGQLLEDQLVMLSGEVMGP